MNQGSAERRSRIRLINPFNRTGVATTTLAALGILSAMSVAACSHSTLPGETAQTLSQQFKNCTGGTGGTSASAQTARPLPVIGGCPSPPPQWDIIVANPGNNSATSYQFTTTGNATPLATLTSSANQLNGDYGIWFDGDTGDFFISNSGSNSVNRYNISCLNGGGPGSGCPDSILSGSQTGLNAPYGATENYGLFLPQGDEPAYTIDTATPAIVAQLENQGGNATPLYTIKGTNTLLADGQGLAIDGTASSPNYGAIYADSVKAKQVMMWLPSSQFPTPAPNATINVAPKKTIGGSATGITDPLGLYVDQSGYLYVVNQSPDKVLVFSPSASGNVAPVNTISASLSKPYGVSVYTDLTVWVTNDGDNSVRSYSNGHGPSSALKSTIMGTNTGLNKPANLDVRIGR